MAAISVSPPFETFKDVDGNPLEMGEIYIGLPGQRAEFFPKNAYWDAGLTDPVSQPAVTKGGFAMNGGAVGTIYVDGDHSITVKDRTSQVVQSALNVSVLEPHPVYTFSSRPLFTAWSDDNSAPDGTLASDGVVSYVASAGATAISDLLGWLPFGAWMFEHWGQTGTADDADVMQLAIDAGIAAGFAVISGSLSEYLVENVRSCDDAGRLGNLYTGEGVHIYGKFKIKKTLANNGSRAVLWIKGPVIAGSIKGIEIDANDAAISAPTVHGIFKNRNLENYEIDGVTIRNTSAYGLGLQDDDGVGAFGYTKNSRFTNLMIINAGDDGLDIKDNAAGTGGNVFSKVFVDGYALNAATSGRVGIHLRGRGDHYSDLTVINPGPAALRGIGVQTTGTVPGNSRDNNLSQFYVDVSGQAGTQGLIVDTPGTSVSSGSVYPGSAGISILMGSGASLLSFDSIKTVSAGGASTGFRAIDGTVTDLKLTSCSADSFDTNYDIRGPGSELHGCRSASSSIRGVRVDAGCTGFKMIGGTITVSAGDKVADFSGTAKIRDVTGYKNAAKVTGSFAIDSTGVKTVAIAHGLDVTPAISDCQVSLGANTPAGADAWESAWFKVDAVDATNVTCQVRVIATSLSSGETNDIHVNVDAVN